MASTHNSPTRAKSWWTVVSGGMKEALSVMSSKPTTLMSSGTRFPRSWSALSTPSAIWSFATNTAVQPGSSASRRPAS